MKKLLSIIAAGTLMSSTAASVVACDKPSEKDDAKPTSAEKIAIENKDMFATPEMVWIESPGGFNLDEWEFDLSSLGVEITKENINEEIGKYLLNSLNPILKNGMEKSDFLNQSKENKGISLKDWIEKEAKTLLTKSAINTLLENPGTNMDRGFDSKFYIKEYNLDNQLIKVNLNDPVFHFIIWNR
ncbi:hypothetical protein SCLARK_00526 [Spiroplasma clarkii]|uniref:Lipoprotein n=1 Tax=Spiroplasma clarkii TaxID=2139 RepID=A0A1Y0KZM6_9MOLU|nr:lipoprotein [Spiroplasma clarkii]ARU91214.1 hypothetical protein SCLARK_00526 [Spiroplasma clarkii]ATX70654.1 hypothetical protein SCLAR_v1c03240 [Spiroplasma clarkii]